MIKIAISTGEVSGDIHAGRLAAEIKKINPSVYLFGMGGEKLRLAGCDVKIDITAKGTVGIVEILKFLPSLLHAFFKMKRLIKRERPDLLVLVDYQGFNMMLASYAKKLGIKTVYYIAPQDWLWGTKKGVKKVSGIIGKIISIFEDEYDAYKDAGANVVYVGNPNLDTAKPSMTKDSFCRTFSLNPSFPIFGIFPGSRRQELESLLPSFLAAAKIIKKKVPNSQFVLALSSGHFEEKVGLAIKGCGLDIKVARGKSHDLLAFSNVSIASSGTTIMEAAILDAPVVMAYKLSRLSEFIAKKILRLSIPFYTMPNLIAKEMVVPEITQDAVNAVNIAEASLKLLFDKKEISRVKEGYRFVRSKIGTPGAVKRAAAEILSELRGKI